MSTPNPEKRKKSTGATIRKWARIFHRDLSYLFTGVLLVYLISGLTLNHRSTKDPNYKITVERYNEPALMTSQDNISKDLVIDKLLAPKGISDKYTRHIYKDGKVTIYLKGGSTMSVDTSSGDVVYTKKKLKWLTSKLNKLHYNPSKAWTIFSDIFVVSLIVIILTGLIMVKGKKGLLGRGGIELIIGILIPILFMFVF